MTTGIRNAMAEMRKKMDEKRKAPGYIAGVAAAELVTKLREDDPELLRVWLDENAESFIRQTMNSIDASERTTARMNAKRGAFFAASEEHKATGNEEPLRGFLGTRFVTEHGVRKTLAEMVGEDRKFVIRDYDRRTRQNAMTAAFLRAIDKKAGERRTDAVYDNVTLDKLWASINGNALTVNL